MFVSRNAGLWPALAPADAQVSAGQRPAFLATAGLHRHCPTSFTHYPSFAFLSFESKALSSARSFSIVKKAVLRYSLFCLLSLHNESRQF